MAMPHIVPENQKLLHLPDYTLSISTPLAPLGSSMGNMRYKPLKHVSFSSPDVFSGRSHYSTFQNIWLLSPEISFVLSP